MRLQCCVLLHALFRRSLSIHRKRKAHQSSTVDVDIGDIIENVCLKYPQMSSVYNKTNAEVTSPPFKVLLGFANGGKGVVL